MTQKDVGDNSPDLANIKVVQKTPVEEKTLLETNEKGTGLTNTLKTPSPPKITATQAVSKALNKLDDSPVKDYLVQINQQLTQQLQQQQRLLQESQRINQQLSQQLNYSQSLNQESQKINQQQVKLLQNYQQLQQLRDKKEPQGWQKIGTQLKNKVGQLLSSLNQWWQLRNQQFKKQNEDKHLAVNLRYFAKQMMGTIEHQSQLSGDKYDLEKNGNVYQLKSKQGGLLMKFQDKGVLGIRVLESNLNPQQKQDVKHLGRFLHDSLFLQNNSQFFLTKTPPSPSNFTIKQPPSPPIPPINQPTDLEQKKDFEHTFQWLKYIVNKKGSELNEINRGGFNIQTTNQGKNIIISRSDNGQLVASQSNNGQIQISPTSTVNDAQQLKQIVKQAVTKVNQILQQKKTGIKTSKGR